MKRLLLLSALFFVACTSSSDQLDEPQDDQNDPTVNPQESVEVTFTSQISTLSRVWDNLFENGDQIFVTAYDQEDIYVSQATYNYGSDFLFSSNSPIIYEPNQFLSFVAIYPAIEGYDDIFSFSVASDQSSAESFTKSDLLVAQIDATTEECPNLIFKHKMSSIVINLTEPAMQGGVMTIYAQRDAYVDIYADSYSASGEVQSITPYSDDGLSYKVILPSQSLVSGSILAVYELNDIIYEITLSNSLALVSGYRYTYEWDIIESDVTYGGDIEGWYDEVLAGDDDGIQTDPDENTEDGDLTTGYYRYTDVTLGGRSQYGGSDQAFLDLDLGVIYEPCSLVDSSTTRSSFDIMFYDQTGYCQLYGAHSTSNTYKNYKCDDTGLSMLIDDWTTTAGANTVKYRTLESADIDHAALIAAFESGEYIDLGSTYDSTTGYYIPNNEYIAAIQTPGNSYSKVYQELTDYSSGSSSPYSEYCYLLVHRSTPDDVYGIIKLTNMTMSEDGTKGMDLTIDYAWGKGVGAGYEGSTSDGDGTTQDPDDVGVDYFVEYPDDGTDMYYRYTNVQMSGRESQGGLYGSFFDCETGVAYEGCGVIGNESLIDFIVYDQSGCISFYSPAAADNIIGNYSCDYVNLNTESWYDIIDDTYGTITKFRSLDPTDADHAAIIAGYEDGSIDFSTITLTGSSSSPKIYSSASAYSSSTMSIAEYPYALVQSYTTGKYGVVKVTSIGEENENGRIVEMTFDMIWQR